MRQAFLIRHGATALNSQNGSVDRIRGWTDIPLSNKGVREAEKLAKNLAHSGIQVIFASSLSRARDTAKPIAEATGAALSVTDRLKPWNLGIFTGKNSNEAHPELKKYIVDKPGAVIPDGESFNSFKNRAFQGVMDALTASRGKMLALVTHHRVERLIKAWLANGQRSDLSIDYETMLERGEPTASAELVILDQDLIRMGLRRAIIGEIPFNKY